MKHLAIVKGDTAEDILSGGKSIEIRFSKSKIAPFGVISAGDIVYIKPSGKDIIGQFRVKKVISIDGVTKEDLENMTKTYIDAIVQVYGDEVEKIKKDKLKYATIIFIGEANRFITSPVKISKRDLRGWMVLD